MRVTGGELGCLEITAPEIFVAKSLGALTRKKMKAQPAPVSSRNSLRFSKKGDKQKENKIGVDLRLELEIADKIFRSNLARSAFELKRRVQRVIDFFNKHDQRPDIVTAQSSAWIVVFQLVNEPARIINAHVKMVPGAPQKRPRELAQFARGVSRQDR